MAFDDLHFERRGYSSMRAYAQSKTANVLFASELARRCVLPQISHATMRFLHC